MDWLKDNSPASVIIVALMTMVIIFLLRRWSRYFRRRERSDSPIVRVPRPKNWQSSISSDASAELIRQEVALHERERDVAARIDSKMGVLQHLIHQAAERITRLESLIEQAGEGARCESDAGAIEATEKGPPAAADPTESGALDAAIQTLAKQGLSAVTIAHHVGKPLSEIESILKYRKGT